MRKPLRAFIGALIVLTAACARGQGDAPLSGVLITLDTTNADALGAFGGREGVAPHLDALAEESVVFERARTVAPLTTPSHASILTGLYPPRHTVRDNAWRPLPQSAVTLAERAREAGFQTAAFLSAVVLAAPYGLDQGFEVYDEPSGTSAGATAHMLERSAPETTRRALTWLSERDPERPFFLWVHYFEPHAPYEPPAGFLAQAGNQPYLGEVAAMDGAVGDLLQYLRNEGLLERSLVAVVGDHGEALGRHGEPTHSVLCYEEVLRVPLLLRHPGGARAGERSAATVSVVDVFPSFLEALELGPPGDVDGLSLITHVPGPERGVYFESYAGYLNYGWSPLTGWVTDTTKYVHGTEPELYQLAQDPAESDNRFERAAPATYRLHREALGALESESRLSPDGAAAAGVDRELIRDARALGYAAAADPSASVPATLAETGLPAPRHRMDELARFYEATLLRNQGRREEAIAKMRVVTEANPNNVYARNVLATFLLEEGRHQEAAAELLGLPIERQQRLNVQDCLGHALEGLGQLERALGHFESALALKPGDAHEEDDVIRVLQRLGRTKEAALVRGG